MSQARINVPDHLKIYLEVEHCDDFFINRYYMTELQHQIYSDIVTMRRRNEELHKLKCYYPNTTLLYGPPGTGKTTFGRYVAYKLDMDFAYINYARLIDGVMGSTLKNLSEIFRFMADTECVFMIDEIDTIAVKRGTDSGATGGEFSRMTSTLMQELDYYRKMYVKSIIIAATNREDILDEALLSRFSKKYIIKNLNNQQKEEYIRQYLEDVGVPYDTDNIKMYCNRSSLISQRNIEADMISALGEWVDNKQKNIELKYER